MKLAFSGKNYSKKEKFNKKNNLQNSCFKEIYNSNLEGELIYSNISNKIKSSIYLFITQYEDNKFTLKDLLAYKNYRVFVKMIDKQLLKNDRKKNKSNQIYENFFTKLIYDFKPFNISYKFRNSKNNISSEMFKFNNIYLRKKNLTKKFIIIKFDNNKNFISYFQNKIDILQFIKNEYFQYHLFFYQNKE